MEGFESEVIAGSLDFLVKQSFPPILFEEWRQGKFSGDVNEMIEKRHAKTRSLLGNLGYQFLNLGLEILAQHPNSKTEAILEQSNSGHRVLKRIR